ncbi:MAG: hypothetical protein FWC11_00625 [Firmicutes bacterium]|nr:hypothetical protein [Bacillota bacterium]
MKKKILSAIIIVIAITGLILFVGCSNWQDYVFQDGDFLLEVTLNKDTASVGDVVEITAILTNKSGQTLPVVLSNGIPRDGRNRFEGSIVSGLTFLEEYRGGLLSDMHSGTRRVRLRDGESISVKRKHEIIVLEMEDSYYITRFAGAVARFSVGRESGDSIFIKSNNVVEITII